MKTQNTNTKIQNFFKSLNTDIDIYDYLNKDFLSDIESITFETISEQIEDNGGLNLEIIYDYNAIEYLKENDPSLTDSLEIAIELDYSLDNLNSEILASLLYSQNEREKFYELEDEINDFFDDLRNEHE